MTRILLAFADYSLLHSEQEFTNIVSLNPSFEIKVTYSEAFEKLKNSLSQNSVPNMNNVTHVLNSTEWNWKEISDKVFHIELRDWAAIFILFLECSIIIKIASGLCDDLPTMICRAWPFKNGKIAKRILIFVSNENTQDVKFKQSKQKLETWGFEIFEREKFVSTFHEISGLYLNEKL